MCHLVSFVMIFDVDKGIVDTAFLDCCSLLKHSLDASPDVDAIVICLTKKYQKLAICHKNWKFEDFCVRWGFIYDMWKKRYDC